jgi:hypothetical protein
MSSYATHLPAIFPWKIDLPRAEANLIIGFLAGQYVPSSFAVTAEPGGQRRRLYLSTVSKRRVEREFPNLPLTTTETE